VRRPFLLAAAGLAGAAVACLAIAVVVTSGGARRDPARLQALVAEAASGSGGPVPRLAVELLTASGEPAAARALGWTLLRAHPDAPGEGRRWLERAARLGDARAAYALALSWREGEGGRRELALAVPWLEQAAAGGVAAAHYLLGNAYRDGEGVAADVPRALAHYEAAAEREDAPALQTLLQAYRLGELGLTPDPERAQGLMRELEHAVHEQRPVL
jgi:TPR repeat protein